MKLLLTNDDGIDAPGLEVLERAVREWADVIVVAPAEVQSGVGHKLTTDRPIAVEQVDAGRYSVQASPADCVRIGLTEIAPDASWVLSGVNRGANPRRRHLHLGHGGAAAREAALLGCRSPRHLSVRGQGPAGGLGSHPHRRGAPRAAGGCWPASWPKASSGT